MPFPNVDPQIVAYVKRLVDQGPNPEAAKMTPERRELLHRLLGPASRPVVPTQGNERGRATGS
ncbi:MAG: hypothetical protein GEV03_28275 [Streptosporangiales bacterium]|nr:hypothetical protein [Streptosporangiales bacterium]